VPVWAWELATGDLQLAATARQVPECWLPDGSGFLTSSAEGCHVHRLGCQRPVATLYPFKDGSVATTPEGFFSGAGRFREYVRFVCGMQVHDFNQFYDAFYRPDLVERKLKGEDISAYTRGLDLTEAIKCPPPKVEVQGLAEGAQLTSRELAVTAKADDAGGEIGDLRLYHNGKLVQSQGVYRVAEDGAAPVRVTQAKTDELYAMVRGAKVRRVMLPKGEKSVRTLDFTPRKGTVTESCAIELVNGENTISACAFNGHNTVMSELVSVKVKCTTPKREPALYVLAVGINQFADPQLNLRFARKDAEDVARLIGQAAKPFYKDVHVKLLLDDQGTKSAIIAEAQRMGAQMEPEDVFVLYIAGHAKAFDDLYYVFTREFDGTVRSETTLSSAELMELSKTAKALKQVLVLDTCQAGSMNSLVAGLYDSRISVLAHAMGAHVLAATGTYQNALDDYQGNGLFTHFLLAGLRGKADTNHDSTVRVKEMAPYLLDAVKAASEDRQTPLVRTFGEDVAMAAPST
jgi:hypothetical protein